ncbi:hypothetical protein [Aliidiomarina taiwanensis]|nr:hypothetical protein [Aliidiomarina taiwanensis]
MSELQPLLTAHKIKTEYPLTLFFNSQGEHTYSHAGTLDDSLIAVNISEHNTPISTLHFNEISEKIPVNTLGKNGTAILFTIDENICPACATEKEALEQFGKHNFSSVSHILVEFR